MRFCIYCGAKHHDDDKFCPECGKKIFDIEAFEKELEEPEQHEKEQVVSSVQESPQEEQSIKEIEKEEVQEQPIKPKTADPVVEKEAPKEKIDEPTKEKDRKALNVILAVLSLLSLVAFYGFDYADDHTKIFILVSAGLALINLVISSIKKTKRKLSQNKMFYAVMITINVFVLLSIILLIVLMSIKNINLVNV